MNNETKKGKQKEKDIEATKFKSFEKKHNRPYLKKTSNSTFDSKCLPIFSQTKKIFFTEEEKKIIRQHLCSDFNPNYRNQYWLVASGAKKQIASNPKYYQSLQKDYPPYIPSPYEIQIEQDLERTFPNDPFFQDKENIEKLKNILVAYSRRNISIGYCQGFNFIVGKFLKRFQNEVIIFIILIGRSFLDFHSDN